MAIQEKANIETLLIAAEVLECDVSKSVCLQPKEHAFPRDSLVSNVQRKRSSYTSTSSSNLNFSLVSDSSQMAASRRYSIVDDFVTQSGINTEFYGSTSSNQIAAASARHPLSDQNPFLSSREFNGKGTLPPYSNLETPETLLIRANSTARNTSAFSSVTDKLSLLPSNSQNILPLKQLRTALLGDRPGGSKVQRAHSDVNQPRLETSVSQLTTSSIVSPEKVELRLPAKKRKFDWRCDRTSALESVHDELPQNRWSISDGLTMTPHQSTSLIVDRPTRSTSGAKRKSSVSFEIQQSATPPFYYPTALNPLKPEAVVKKRKLSFPDSSFASDTRNLFSTSSLVSSSNSFLPPLIISMRDHEPTRRSSLVMNVSTPISTSPQCQMRSSPLRRPCGDVKVEEEFSSPTLPPPPFLQHRPSHHSEAGRRYSVVAVPSVAPSGERVDFDHVIMGPPSNSSYLQYSRRHSSVLPISCQASPSAVTSYSPFHQTNDNMSLDRPQISNKNTPIENSSQFCGVVSSEYPPLLAPENRFPTCLRLQQPSLMKPDLSPHKQRPTSGSSVASRHRTIPINSTLHSPTASGKHHRRISHVTLLSSILRSTFADQQNQRHQEHPSYPACDRKRSLDSLFARGEPYRCDGGEAVLLTGGDLGGPPSEKSFSDGGFPLLLVSAPTSASAAKFAAATAVASGVPPCSLIPVPVQIVPDANSISSSGPTYSSHLSSETGVTLVSKTTNDADAHLVFPLLPGANGKINGCALGIPLLVSNCPRKSSSPQ